MKPEIKILRPDKCYTTLKKAGITDIAFLESSLPSSVRAVELLIDHTTRMPAELCINGTEIKEDGSVDLICSKAIRTITEDKLIDDMMRWHTLYLRVTGLSKPVAELIRNGYQYSSVSKDQQLILFVGRARSKQQLERCGKVIASTC